MNRDIVEGNWTQFKGTLQARRGMLIGDSLRVITGKRTQLAGERQKIIAWRHEDTLSGAPCFVEPYSQHVVLPEDAQPPC